MVCGLWPVCSFTDLCDDVLATVVADGTANHALCTMLWPCLTCPLDSLGCVWRRLSCQQPCSAASYQQPSQSQSQRRSAAHMHMWVECLWLPCVASVCVAVAARPQMSVYTIYAIAFAAAALHSMLLRHRQTDAVYAHCAPTSPCHPGLPILKAAVFGEWLLA